MILVVCLGLIRSSMWSLRIARAFSEAFWTLSPKGLEKYLAILQDHIALLIRPRQTTKIRIGPFGTRQKRFEVFRTSNSEMVT